MLLHIGTAEHIYYRRRYNGLFCVSRVKIALSQHTLVLLLPLAAVLAAPSSCLQLECASCRATHATFEALVLSRAHTRCAICGPYKWSIDFFYSSLLTPPHFAARYNCLLDYRMATARMTPAEVNLLRYLRNGGKSGRGAVLDDSFYD